MEKSNTVSNNTEGLADSVCYVSLVLEGTAACLMRDELNKARFNKRITPKEITERLSKMDIPEWLRCQILQMSNHRKYERTTCPIEQAMESAVNYHIVKELAVA